MKTIKLIEKRIKELKKMRNSVESNASKSRYSFVIGEMMNLILDIQNEK